MASRDGGTLRPQLEASPPSTGVARETVRVAVNGIEHELEIVRQPRIHGQEAYWRCSQCSELRRYLFIHNGVACWRCLGLSHASRHTRNRAPLRAAKIRRRLGGLPGLLAPLPKRPKYWRRDYWARSIAELSAVEASIVGKLRDMVGHRRKRDGRRYGARGTR